MVEVMHGDCKCAKCVYATVVAHATDSTAMRVYCPYADCVYEDGGDGGNDC